MTAVPIVRAVVVQPEKKLVVTPVSREMEAPDASLSVLLARADPEAGQETAKTCAICHTWTKGGGIRVGPNLYGVVGRDIARDPGFYYSPALQQKGGGGPSTKSTNGSVIRARQCRAITCTRWVSPA